MLLTGVLLGLGFSATFAQSAIQPSNMEGADLMNIMTSFTGEGKELMLSAKERKGKSLRLEELPEAVRSAFLEGKYAEYGIVFIQAEPADLNGRKDRFTFTLAGAGSPTFRLGAGHGRFTPIDNARTGAPEADLLLQFNEDGTLLQVKELVEESGKKPGKTR